MLSAEGPESPAVAPEQDAPVGPSPDEEAAFLAEQHAGEPAFSIQRSAHGADSGTESVRDLPPMDDLVKRIPLPARDLMEELFRAKFITVKRIPPSALKP